MPNFDIIRKVSPQKTFRVASVMGSFDLQSENIEEHFIGNIDMPDNWQIGLIVGNSGTGKTTIAKELFPEAYIESFQYSAETILDDFPEECSMQEIFKALNSVGFSSPPSWLKPYSVLSNGEKMRCDLARAILSKKRFFVFDEFTSVVDRNIARIGSFAMQKAIRKTNKKFIAVTCHFDVEDWLLPDWIFDTNTMTFRINEVQKKNRPPINFKIYETKEKEHYWRMFKRYHYLSHSFNKAARVFIGAMNDDVCAICAILPFPHPKLKNTWKEHRTVVLPDYQGIGLGSIFTNEVGNMLIEEGKTFITTTSNPALIHSRCRDAKWICTRHGRTARGSEHGLIQNKHKKGSTSANRITVSFKYVGE